VLAFPTAASAQASLGVVKDTSGAVLPGVTVEASSSALIEKARSVITDNGGQYKIVDLRPGTYAVTFTLTGCSTVKRDGIELTGSGTTTVNADLKIGTVEETITVRGETPVVDVQSATRQAVLSGDLVASAPAARSWNGILLLMPGVTGDPNTIQLTPQMITFGIHGGPTSEGRLLVDGMNVGASRGGAGVSGYAVDSGNVQEVTFATPAASARPRPAALHECRAEDRRQHVQRILRGPIYEPVVAGQQLHAGITRCGLAGTGRALEKLGRGWSAGWTNQEGPAVVLLHRTQLRERLVGPWHVRQRQRRRSKRLDLRP
jgi:hypothetical protein